MAGILTAQGISATAIRLLVRELVLPRTVTPVPGEEFAGANGDTITVRVPQPRAARKQETKGATITYDDTNEVPVNVTLSHLYNAALISDEDMSLALTDFARQITLPQLESIAEGAEDEVATVMNDLAADSSVAADGSDIEEVTLAAREQLGRDKVPAAGRFAAVSPEIATFFLSLDKFSRVDASGDASALRDARIGRLYGFDFVESPGLEAGSAVFYHRSGFCFANRVPVRPRGATESATANHQGIGLRQIFQYETSKLSDASVVSTFAGAAAVYEDDSGATAKRFYKIDTAAS